MYIYIVTRAIPKYIANWRVSAAHSEIYHGHCVKDRDLGHYPRLTNSDRRPLRIMRSIGVVPRVQLPARQLIVDARLMSELSQIDGMQFLPVKFDRLVDLALPAIGDFSKMGAFVDASIAGDVGLMYRSVPDLPVYYQSIGPFYQVLCAGLYDLKGEYNDFLQVDPDWGSYVGNSPSPCDVSVAMSKQYPIVTAGPLIIREDAFKVIAPHLNLDYFAVAWADV